MPIRIPRSGLAGATPLPVGGVTNAGEGAEATGRAISRAGADIGRAIGNIAGEVAAVRDENALQLEEQRARDRAREKQETAKFQADLKRKTDEAKRAAEKLKRDKDNEEVSETVGGAVADIQALAARRSRGEITTEQYQESIAELRTGIAVDRVPAGQQGPPQQRSDEVVRKVNTELGTRLEPILQRIEDDYIAQQQAEVDELRSRRNANDVNNVTVDDWEDRVAAMKARNGGDDPDDTEREIQTDLESRIKANAKTDGLNQIGLEVDELVRGVNVSNLEETIEDIREAIFEHPELFDSKGEQKTLEGIMGEAVGDMFKEAGRSATTLEQKLELLDKAKTLLGEGSEHRALRDKIHEGMVAEMSAQYNNLVDEENDDATPEDIAELKVKMAEMRELGLIPEGDFERRSRGLDAKLNQMETVATTKALAKIIADSPVFAEGKVMTGPLLDELNKIYVADPVRMTEVFGEDTTPKRAGDQIVKDTRGGSIAPVYSNFLHGLQFGDADKQAFGARIYEQILKRSAGQVSVLKGAGANATLEALDPKMRAFYGHMLQNLDEMNDTQEGREAASEAATEAVAEGKRLSSTKGGGVSAVPPTVLTAYIDTLEKKGISAATIKPGHQRFFEAQYQKHRVKESEESARNTAGAEANLRWRVAGGGEIDGVYKIATEHAPTRAQLEAFILESKDWTVGYQGINGNDIQIPHENMLGGIEFGKVDGGNWTLLYHPLGKDAEGNEIRLTGYALRIKGEDGRWRDTDPWFPDVRTSESQQIGERARLEAKAKAFNELFDGNLRRFETSAERKSGGFSRTLQTASGAGSFDPRLRARNLRRFSREDMLRLTDAQRVEAGRTLKVQVETAVEQMSEIVGIKGPDKMEQLIEMFTVPKFGDVRLEVGKGPFKRGAHIGEPEKRRIEDYAKSVGNTGAFIEAVARIKKYSNLVRRGTDGAIRE